MRAQTQRILTHPVILPLTVIFATVFAWVISKAVKENR